MVCFTAAEVIGESPVKCEVCNSPEASLICIRPVNKRSLLHRNNRKRNFTVEARNLRFIGSYVDLSVTVEQKISASPELK